MGRNRKESKTRELLKLKQSLGCFCSNISQHHLYRYLLLLLLLIFICNFSFHFSNFVLLCCILFYYYYYIIIIFLFTRTDLFPFDVLQVFIEIPI